MSSRQDVLTEERDFLLSSLRDLEVEFAAGDLSDVDYQTLKDDYTVRAADVIRSLNELQNGSKQSRSASNRTVVKGSNRSAQQQSPKSQSPKSQSLKSQSLKSQSGTAGQGKSGRSKALVLGGLFVFIVGAGYLLGQALGERGTGELSGSIDESLRSKFDTCQGHLQSLEAAQALECYDSVLAEDPKHVEALTYRGWQLYQVARGAQQSGDAEVFAQFIVMSEQSLTDAIGINPAFADALAFRVVVHSTLDRDSAACEDVAALADLRPDPLLEQLVQPVVDGLTCS